MTVTAIKHIWIEQQGVSGFDPYNDSTDVIVETEDGQMWLAAFVTIPFIQRQMFLSQEISTGVKYMAPIRFTALETPHVIVENLLPETIEDTIDNLMTLGTFESVFMVYSEAGMMTPGGM
jgi:hypothetical protein